MKVPTEKRGVIEVPRGACFVSACGHCIYFKKDLTCKAFPKGIPAAFLVGASQHTFKAPGQVGTYTFKRKKSK